MAESELTTRQRRSIAALLTERSLPDAARLANVGERTLYRWLEQPGYQKALRSAETEVIDAASRRLLIGQGKALDTLSKLMTSAESESVRRQAARDWIDLWLKIREFASFENRLAELEVFIYAKTQPKPTDRS